MIMTMVTSGDSMHVLTPKDNIGCHVRHIELLFAAGEKSKIIYQALRKNFGQGTSAKIGQS